jgi:multidrug efflux pump
VFFGMLGVTLFGLLLTPVFYVVLRTLAGGKIHVAQKDSAGYGMPATDA